MIKERLQEAENDNVEINLSPMIDCIFILLIFFILTTVFVEETGIEVNKPNAAKSVALEKTASSSPSARTTKCTTAARMWAWLAFGR